MYEPGNRSQFATLWFCHLEKLILSQELLLATGEQQLQRGAAKGPFLKPFCAFERLDFFFFFPSFITASLCLGERSYPAPNSTLFLRVPPVLLNEFCKPLIVTWLKRALMTPSHFPDLMSRANQWQLRHCPLLEHNSTPNPPSTQTLIISQ